MICSSKKQSNNSKNKFHIRSHKVLRMNTIQKSIDNQPQIVVLPQRKKLSRARINTLNSIQLPNKTKIRKYTEIYCQESVPSSPLSPLRKATIFKQYQTKLKMSGQSWVIYDTLKNQYKRGFKPNNITKFNGLIKFLVLTVYCQLLQKNDKFKKIRLIINSNNLNLNKKQLSIEIKNRKVKNHFQTGSILYFTDLIKSMIISGQQQFFQYSVLICGFLISKLQEQILFKIGQYIVIQQGKQEYFIKKFCKYTSDNIIQIINDIIDTKIIYQEDKCELISTVNQIAKIFLFCFEKYKVFKQIIKLQKLKSYYKYQVGFNYWQDRIFNVNNKNLNPNPDHFCKLVYKGKQNYDVICLNHALHILMIIENSKFSMGDLDIEVLQNWVLNVTKNIGKQRKQSCIIISPNKNKKITLPLISITNN